MRQSLQKSSKWCDGYMEAIERSIIASHVTKPFAVCGKVGSMRSSLPKHPQMKNFLRRLFLFVP
jgi:hypothetical protein